MGKKKRISKNKRKLPKKKLIEVTIRKKLLGEAPKENCFVAADGRKLKDLFELVDALENMSEEVFRQHANEFRNDFSNWVRDVFEEPELAKEIVIINDRIKTELTILKYLVKELRKLMR